MGTAKSELATAIQQIAANRAVIIDSLRLNPAVFDSWLHAAESTIEEPADRQSLRIISTWIRGLPELGQAREVIQEACVRASTPNGAAPRSSVER